MSLFGIPYGKLKREKKLYFGNFGTGRATKEFKVSTEAYQCID